MRCLLAIILLLAAAPAAAEDVSGQIVALGQPGRVVLNLTSAHLRGGERARVVRATGEGGWVLAAVGEIIDVSSTQAVLEVRRYEPGMLEVVVGDFVVVSRLSPSDAGYAGHPGGDARPRDAAPAAEEAPAEPPSGPAAPAGRLGDQLAIDLGFRYVPGFAGKLPASDAPQWDDSGFAGYGWALGPVVELRAMRYVAFETGLLFYRNTLKKRTTVYRQPGCLQGDFVDIELGQAITNDALRIPLLIKGVLPVDLGEDLELRSSLGGGAELVFGRTSELDVDVTPECQVPGMGKTSPVDQQTFLVVSLGVSLAVGNLILSLDLRGAYNPNGTEQYRTYLPKDPNDPASLGGETVPMGHAADLALALGVGYEYDAM